MPPLLETLPQCRYGQSLGDVDVFATVLAAAADCGSRPRARPGADGSRTRAPAASASRPTEKEPAAAVGVVSTAVAVSTAVEAFRC